MLAEKATLFAQLDVSRRPRPALLPTSALFAPPPSRAHEPLRGTAAAAAAAPPARARTPRRRAPAVLTAARPLPCSIPGASPPLSRPERSRLPSLVAQRDVPQSDVPPPSRQVNRDGTLSFDEIDTNRDGKITQKEFLRMEEARAAAAKAKARRPLALFGQGESKAEAKARPPRHIICALSLSPRAP